MRLLNTRSLFALALLASPCAAMMPGASLPSAADRPATPIVIDPGHGGSDEGAIVRGVMEKDVALAFAKKLKTRLTRDPELNVVMTREDDRYVRLDDRLIETVDASGMIFVSLHLNQVKGKKSAGAIVYSFGPEKLRAWRKKSHPTVAPMPAPPGVQSGNSAVLAAALSKGLRADGFRAEASKSDYYVLKNPSSPAVLIELGYLNNPDEAAKLVDPAYQDRMVESIAKSLEQFAATRATRAVASR